MRPISRSIIETFERRTELARVIPRMSTISRSIIEAMSIIYDGTSKFNRYRIIDRTYNDRPSRLLLSGNQATPQSGLAFDDNLELLFDYNQRLLEVALSLRPLSVLVIGGGAFTLPRSILDHLPEAQVDAVEIDPLLLRLARRYFQLKRNRRLNIHIGDGRDYIDQHQGQYDLIIVDAFNEYVIPKSLLTVEAAQQYAKLLTPNGTLALNIIAKYNSSLPTLAHRLLASFHDSFTSLTLYPADIHDPKNEEQNLIFVASHQPSPSLDYLLSSQVHPQQLDESALQMRDADLG